MILLPASAMAQTPRLLVELEGGPVWQSYNDVEVPNDGTAMRFALDELAGNGPWPAGRLYITWNLSERHGLRALVAPLSFTETGTPAEPIRFAGADYAAGEPAQATYTFNSYRLTYRYRVAGGDRSTAWIGFTAKIRDAHIALEQGPTSSRKDDVGFVPLPSWPTGSSTLATCCGASDTGSCTVGPVPPGWSYACPASPMPASPERPCSPRRP